MSQNNNALADAFLSNCDFDPTWTLHLLLDTESLIGQLKQKMRARISRQDQNHFNLTNRQTIFIYLFKTIFSDYSLLPKLRVVRAPASPIRLSADTGTQNSPWHRLGHETPCMPCAPEVASQLTGYVDTAPHEGPFPSLRSVVQNGRQKWVLKISLNRL